MTTIEILEQDEVCYQLEEIGCDAELILNEQEMYITSPAGFFPIVSLEEFVIEKEHVTLSNEDNDILYLTLEQFKLIKPILENNISTNK